MMVTWWLAAAQLFLIKDKEAGVAGCMEAVGNVGKEDAYFAKSVILLIYLQTIDYTVNSYFC